MVPSCLLISALHGSRTTLASLLGSAFILAYNEGGGARAHWLVRNAENAVGYSIAKAGAMLVVCSSLSSLHPTCLSSPESVGRPSDAMRCDDVLLTISAKTL
jgi:hypothetical protein